MRSHMILLSSSYSNGTRIALDFLDKDFKNVQGVIDEIIDKCHGDMPFSVHSLGTPDETWESVWKTDPYFESVEVIPDKDKFIELIMNDRVLVGTDIAKYILSREDGITHLKLEKLCYLCYADYLCSEEKRLFEDKIFAYRYGPVVKSVYETYREYAGDPITEKGMPKRPHYMSARSRILFAEDGRKKFKSIEATLNKYQDYSAYDLIDITHRPGSPWAHCDSLKMNEPIDDALIREFHNVEAV